MSDNIKDLEQKLDAPIEYAGTDTSVLKRGLTYLANGVTKLRSYFGRKPRVRKYVIRRLEPGVAGTYLPEEQVTTLNETTLEQDPELGEEAAVHEGVHDIQNQTGSIKAYFSGLRERYGFLGLILLKPIIEGTASFYTKRIRGKTKDGYGHFRAGAEQMAKDHGEKSLIDPVYISKNLGSMITSFIKGMFSYKPAYGGGRA